MIDKHRGWHEMLPYALLGYRTTVRILIGDTPYLLVYGTEVVIPAEVEIPSLKIIQEDELSNVEWLYRQRMVHAFQKRVRARVFEVGQLVLKRIFPHQDEYQKFTPNWQGPYMVRKVLSRAALVLSEMDGTISKFRDLLSYGGKISKTVNWDRNFEDGLKISAWVYLRVRSDSKTP
ncbi:uncharacterized protein [Solanum lycopersicum]|uniref:uncharacterized protein n=1 Tax=Solanum lycopersicum TaxID=4081 RepID=UPI0002BCAA1E|nr:uncharacterized protein LOC101243634 [Solanum lycopersicum]